MLSIFFFNGNPLFFLDASPFNCLNDSIKILLHYISWTFLRKKNKVGKNKFPYVRTKFLYCRLDFRQLKELSESRKK
jgi:hypothetical protein